ncbi:MAG: hypothetical protein U0835_22220 [Isosphaeraceae bacterium]
MTLLLRLAGLLSLALAGLSFAMDRSQKYDPPMPSPLPQGLSSPVLALELVRSPAEAREIFRDPIGGRNRETFGQSIALDWPFIGVYWLYFTILGLPLLRGAGPGARLAGLAVVAGAFAAAQWDVFEDLGILVLLDTPPHGLTQTMTDHVRLASLVKWGSLGVVELGLAVLFFSYGRIERFPRFFSTAAGLAFAASGVLGLAGLYRNPLIEWSVGLLALGMLLALPVLVFAPGRFLAGIGAAGRAGGA